MQVNQKVVLCGDSFVCYNDPELLFILSKVEEE